MKQPVRFSRNPYTNIFPNLAPNTSSNGNNQGIPNKINYGNSQGISATSNHGNNQQIPFATNYGNSQKIPSTSNYGNNQGIPITSNNGMNQGITSTSNYGNNQGIPITSNNGNNQGITSTSNYGNNQGIPITSNNGINQGITSTSNNGKNQEIPMPSRMNSVMLDRSRYIPAASAPQIYNQNTPPYRGNKPEHQSFPSSQSAVQASTIMHNEGAYFIAITYCSRCMIYKEHLLNRPGKWPTKLCFKCGMNWFIIDWKTYISAEDKDVIYIGEVIKSLERKIPLGYSIKKIKMEPQEKFPNTLPCYWCRGFHEVQSNIPEYCPNYNGGLPPCNVLL